MEIGNEMNKQAAAPAGAGAAAMSAAAPATGGAPPATGAKQGAVRERVERLVIVARGSDGEEWIMAGEETIVFTCPRCAAAFTVERDGTVTFYRSLDDLIRDLIEEWNLLLEDEGVTVQEVRVERW